MRKLIWIRRYLNFNLFLLCFHRPSGKRRKETLVSFIFCFSTNFFLSLFELFLQLFCFLACFWLIKFSRILRSGFPKVDKLTLILVVFKSLGICNTVMQPYAHAGLLICSSISRFCSLSSNFINTCTTKQTCENQYFQFYELITFQL